MERLAIDDITKLIDAGKENGYLIHNEVDGLIVISCAERFTLRGSERLSPRWLEKIVGRIESALVVLNRCGSL